VGCLGVGILLLCEFIYGLCLISGLFPVVSCVFIDNSLIINDIHFCRSYAFAGSFCGEVGHTLECVGCCGKVCCDALWGIVY
jgi:hypothetical protein